MIDIIMINNMSFGLILKKKLMYDPSILTILIFQLIYIYKKIFYFQVLHNSFTLNFRNP